MPDRNPRPYYENIEFTLNDGESDYDLAANQATFQAVFGASGKPGGGYATEVEIRTNQTISVKFNATTNHSITIASTDSPFKVTGLEVRNMYLSNASGSNAAVKLFFKEYTF